MITALFITAMAAAALLSLTALISFALSDPTAWNREDIG